MILSSSPKRTPNPPIDRGQLEESSPFVAYQYVTVTFPSSPNTDYPIAHSLTPQSAEAVDYEVVRKDRAADVYHDQTGTRKAWGTGYIILRCNTASAVVDLRLSIRRT